LIGKPDVVEAIASWNFKDGVVVLDRIESATVLDGYDNNSSKSPRSKQLLYESDDESLSKSKNKDNSYVDLL